jgi:hypothetical protein
VNRDSGQCSVSEGAGSVDFSNVVHAQPGSGWRATFEGGYLGRFFEVLEQKLGARFHRYQYLVAHHNTLQGPPALPLKGNHTVLIWLSDEAASIPRHLSREYALILKSYWPLLHPLDNIHPFPLCVSNEVLGQSTVPYLQRSANVFFSGNLNSQRLDLFRQFSSLRKLPDCDITIPLLRKLYSRLIKLTTRERDFSGAWPDSKIAFTSGFRQGFSGAEFAALLAQAGIALCPAGFVNPETIRHFEAMSLGCVIISALLPPNRFYYRSPILQLGSWRQLFDYVSMLLDNPQRAAEQSAATLDWWRNVCSPEAMAAYAAELL